MPSRLSKVSFPDPESKSVVTEGRPKPKLPSKQNQLDPQSMDTGCWVLVKGENGKTTLVSNNDCA